LGTAVKRNPAIAAPMKPAIISWACQRAIGSGPSGSLAPSSAAIQTSIATTAQRPANRKNGRKP
jgi:hypothetical protein